MHQPLKYLTLLYILGLYLGRALQIPPQAAQVLLSILSLATLLSFPFRRGPFSCLVVALFFPLGILLCNGHPSLKEGSNILKGLSDSSYRIVEGTVASRDDRGDRKRFVVEAERVFDRGNARGMGGRILLTVGSGADTVVPGDMIRFRGRLKRPRNFSNPGGFDYEGFLGDRGISATSFLKDDKMLAIIGDGPGFWRWLYAIRKKTGDAIEASTTGKTRGVIAALSLGNRGYMESDLVRSFRKAGAAHILAISGLHMGIIAFFFYRMFRWLLSRSERVLLHNMAGKGAAVMTLLPLTAYLFISGMATSAVRAYIMVAVFLLSVILEKESDIFNTISLAALIILMIWPYSLFEASFQLSFAAVIAIVYMVPRMEAALFKQKDEGERTIPGKLRMFILVSLAASAGTAPIVAYHFMEVSTVGIISNLLVVPLLGFVVVPLSSIALLASPLAPALARTVFAFASHLTSLCIFSVEFISSLPLSSILTKPPAFHRILLFYTLIWSTLNIRRKGVVAFTAIISLLFISSKAVNSIQEGSSKNLEVTFLSVGQGESTFISFPEGKTMLIDGGGFYDNSFDTGEMVVRPYLLSQGVKRIDYLVMTHPHSDHMNGLLHILNEFDIGEVWTTDEPIIDDNHRLFKDVIRDRNIRKKRILDESPDILVDGVKIEFLHPPADFRKGADNGSRGNNRSLVMRLKYGQRTFLLPGDLESEGEMRILEEMYDIGADVIKVPHHGSRTSSSPDFIKSVSPEYAVFTVGYMNRFGFPIKGVVKRYKEIGCETYRTDMDGAVTFLTDGERLEVKTFRNSNIGRI